MLNVGEPIGLDVRELPHAALDADGAAFADLRDQVTLLQEARGGIVLDRLVQARLKIHVLLFVGGDADAGRGFVLVVGLRQRQLEAQSGAVGEQRLHLQGVVRPLTLQTRDQGALERRMGFLFE